MFSLSCEAHHCSTLDTLSSHSQKRPSMNGQLVKGFFSFTRSPSVRFWGVTMPRSFLNSAASFTHQSNVPGSLSTPESHFRNSLHPCFDHRKIESTCIDARLTDRVWQLTCWGLKPPPHLSLNMGSKRKN